MELSVTKTLMAYSHAGPEGMIHKYMPALQEAYASLTTKTLVFLQLITSQFDADYIWKVDDDVYLRTDRMPYAMAQWTQHRAGMLSVLHCFS